MNKPVRDEQWTWSAPAPDEFEEEGATLRDYVGIILQSWKLILFILFIAAVAGAYLAWTAPPVYATNSLIQVEPKPGSSISSSLEDPLSAYFQEEAQGLAEIEIIESRSVLRHAVEKLKLDIAAEPRYFGGLGAAMARGAGGQPQSQLAESPPQELASLLPEAHARFFANVAGYLPNMSRYAWGGEQIAVSRLNVAPSMEGVQLVLVLGEGGAYRVYCDDNAGLLGGQNRPYCGGRGTTLLEGQVGEAADAKTAGGPISIFVAEINGRPGTEFLIRKLPIQEAVLQLHDSLTVVETGDGTGMLELTLQGPSASGAKQRLNAIANSYLLQNVERQSEETRQTLEFVNSQLPELREAVDTSQVLLRDYQKSKGTVDLSLESQGMLNNVSEIDRRISELDLHRTELARLYTEDHPLLKSLEDKRAQLEVKRDRIEQRLKTLPDVESDYLKLARNARVANELYVTLLNRSQELRVTEAGVTGYVHIIDYAVKPLLPAGPHRPLIAFVSVLLGAVFALGVVFLRRALRRTLETPDDIERKLGIPVYATIPHSKQEARLEKRKAKSVETSVLARWASKDNAIESLRSLRTSLQFALIETKNNVITITGPTPGLGKTFVAVNLAFLLADVNKRVLLVDGDMRRGHMHNYMGHHRSPGLSDVIAGQKKLKEAIHLIDNRGLYFMATGTLPPNPSELLVHDNFTKLIEVASEEFDMIIFDTPPILNLTDGIIIAKHSGTTFLVARGNVSTIHDVELSAKRLQQNDIKLSGVVFNDLKLGSARYGYGKYGYYAYKYKPAKA